MPVTHHFVFTGRMPFLPPNQQRQSTEGNINSGRCVLKCNASHIDLWTLIVCDAWSMWLHLIVFIYVEFYFSYRIFCVYCQQVAILGGCAENIVEIAFEFGRNIGIAFQVSCGVLVWKLSNNENKFKLYVCIYVSFGQGFSLLWTHTLRLLYSRPIVLTQKGRSQVDDVCECVCGWRVRRGE